MTFDFDLSTIQAIKEFRRLMTEVKAKYPNLTMPMAREYLKNGTKINGVPEELYSDLDKLAQVRTAAINTEKEYMLAQAQKAGLKLPESIISGESLIPFFEDGVYEVVPTLKVYEYMTFYLPEEIAQMREKYNITEDSKKAEEHDNDSER